MKLMDWVTLGLKIMAEVFGFARERNAANNRPEMVEAKRRQDEADARDRMEKAVRDQNAEEIRKQLAE